jgi:hypothetical protein
MHAEVVAELGSGRKLERQGSIGQEGGDELVLLRNRQVVNGIDGGKGRRERKLPEKKLLPGEEKALQAALGRNEDGHPSVEPAGIGGRGFLGEEGKELLGSAPQRRRSVEAAREGQGVGKAEPGKKGREGLVSSVKGRRSEAEPKQSAIDGYAFEEV